MAKLWTFCQFYIPFPNTKQWGDMVLTMKKKFEHSLIHLTLVFAGPDTMIEIGSSTSG